MARSAPSAPNWLDLRTALLLIVLNMSHLHKHAYSYTLHVHSFDAFAEGMCVGICMKVACLKDVEFLQYGNVSTVQYIWS